jgi:hypothetical protein
MYDDENLMTPADLERLGADWLDRIRQSEKREEDWIKQAQQAEKAYLSDAGTSVVGGKVYDFNILHSNIETMLPAVFNSSPMPDIRERFRVGNETPEAAVSKEVAQVLERTILLQTDDAALVTEAEGLTQDALLAGRGVLRIKFEADEEIIPGQPVIDPMTGMPMIAEDGMPLMGPDDVRIVNERVIYEAVSWRDYREGPAKRWKDVPWVAFRHCIPWEQVEDIRDPEIKAILAGGDTTYDRPNGKADTHIWEIWCKDTRRVYMIVAGSGEVLSIQDDPMELSQFFPCVQPAQPVMATGTRTPVCPFTIWRPLAEELEKITRRINRITEGLKVRGLTIGSMEDLERLAQADDNTLVVASGIEGFVSAGGNLDNAIAWWPIERAIQVLRELYSAREQTKAMIYEITGISDIIRGDSRASETATAQSIKAQFASLRIMKLQNMIERACRDIFVLTAEVICTKFSIETLQQITGIPITPPMAQMLQSSLNHYRIDVESDSTVRADLGRRRGEIAEFLQGTATYFSTMAPIVQQAPPLAGPIMNMYAAFARQFSLGRQAENALEQMVEMAQQAAQQPPPPDPRAIAAEARAKAEAEKVEVAKGRLQLDENVATFNAAARAAQLGGM